MISFQATVKTSIIFLQICVYFVAGALMILSWLGFASVGMFMARYMRKTWSKKVFEKDIWFQVSMLDILWKIISYLMTSLLVYMCKMLENVVVFFGWIF